MDNQKQKRSAGTIALVVLLLIVTIASLVLATYAWAKYTEKLDEKTANVQVAKWNVTAEVDGTAKYTKEFTHVVSTKMAPGTSGVIPVNVKLNDTDVCVKYDIFVDQVTNKPTHLKFYKATKSGEGTSATYTKGAEITATDGKSAAITGYLELTGDKTNNPTAEGNEYIMWDWPYEMEGAATAGADAVAAYDKIDTDEGKLAQTMSVKVRVVATQVEPGTAATIDNPSSGN